MTGITSLEQSRRLKRLGFPQGEFPQFLWYRHGYTGQIDYESGWQIHHFRDGGKFPSGAEYPHIESCAAPVLLSGDPERPGVVEWLRAKGWQCEMQRSGRWLAYPPSWVETPSEPTADTLSAVVDLVLGEVEKPDAK